MKKTELVHLIDEIVQRVINEEVGLSKKFDKTIDKYRNLLLKKQDAMKQFVSDFKQASGDVKKQEKIKQKHIESMKKLDSEIEIANDKSIAAIDDLEPDEEL